MSVSPIIVRQLATNAERDLLFQLADQAFSHEPSLEGARQFQAFLMNSPWYRPEMLRGAFQDGIQVGSYILEERKLRMGTAELLTGCIGAVVTHPEHRKKSVATALMQDAIRYAEDHQYALLLLDGIPKFYYRFGYTDMFDLSVQDVDRSAIMTQPASTHTVRSATLDDAEAVLDIYNRYYGPYTGSFTRTVEAQAYALQQRSPENPLLLSVAPTGQVQGYLSLSRGKDRWYASEIAAESWEAMLALLQHHNQLVGDTTERKALRYRTPPISPILQWMVDILEQPDTSHWESPSEEWAVQNQTYYHHFAAWMARLVSFQTLMQASLPELQVRWQRALAFWSGTITLAVGEETCTLSINGRDLSLVTQSTAKADLSLTPQAFVQLVFGYHPLAWLLQQGEQQPEQEVVNALNVLFPSGHTWIPASDWF